MKTTIPTIALVVVGLIIFLSFKLEKNILVQNDDYQVYLGQNNPSTDDQKEIDFWAKKLSLDTNCTTCKLKIASALSKRFKEKSKVQDLLKADSLLQTCLDQKLGLTSVYHSLASLSVSRHNFKESWEYCQKALELGEKKDVTYFLLFDAAMELGHYIQAESFLNRFKDKKSFNYLLRSSKLADKKGDLGKAIQLMEMAMKKTHANDELYVWAISNLGDMYGHAGQIEQSYDAFLKALKKDPNHSHSKMGLAWIAFSHDRNPKVAKEILKNIYSHKPDPQIILMLAEIALYEKNFELNEILKEDYYQLVSQSNFGFMYSKYLILMDAEKDTKKAVKRALIEIERRATPETYDLLAWSYFKNNQLKKALEVAKNHVVGQTSEPETLFHLGMIYKANKELTQAENYLEEALESEFEIGPLASHEIRNALK